MTQAPHAQEREPFTGIRWWCFKKWSTTVTRFIFKRRERICSSHSGRGTGLSCGVCIEQAITDELIQLTRLLDEHPEDWNGPCECPTCMSYAAEDGA